MSGNTDIPAFVEGMKAMMDAIEVAASQVITDDVFDNYDTKKAKAFLDKVDEQLARIKTLRNDLRGHIDAIEKASKT